jgi:periplasmic divalent cation tolerance protein
MPDEYVVVLSTLPPDKEPLRIGRILVEERLAACVNVLPLMTSIYRWREEIEEDPEHQMIIKTTRARLPALRERLRGLHPYDVPEFIVLPIIDGSDAYLRWIAEAVS